MTSEHSKVHDKGHAWLEWFDFNHLTHGAVTTLVTRIQVFPLQGRCVLVRASCDQFLPRLLLRESQAAQCFQRHHLFCRCFLTSVDLKCPQMQQKGLPVLLESVKFKDVPWVCLAVFVMWLVHVCYPLFTVNMFTVEDSQINWICHSLLYILLILYM